MAESNSGVECLICGKTCTRILIPSVRDRLHASKDVWQFLSCDGCGSANLFPRPSSDALLAAYPPEYSKAKLSQGRSVLLRLAHLLIYRPIVTRQCRWTVRQVKNSLGPCKLLDVGCGAGLHLREFRKLGFDVVGVDTDQNVTHILAQRGFRVISGTLSDALACFGSASFEVVTAFHVLEHVLDARHFLDEVWEILKAGGFFCGAVPVCDGLLAQLFGPRWSQFTEVPRHTVLPSFEGLSQALRRRFASCVFARESLINVAGMCALSLVPQATWSLPHRSFIPKLLGGALAISCIPLVLFSEVLVRRWSVVMFAARKSD